MLPVILSRFTILSQIASIYFILSILFYRFCFMCITELFTSCTLYFVRDDKDKNVQSSNYDLYH